ncbi:hypothetical protein B_027 [Cronobacter phage vB_CsaM_leB]|uniref:Uncharacterized protein n=1 Tax=Cronobacter phage vB_CsaM_leB TaxID=1885242 RepID=A0A1W5N052_9CAUD|nr:hypothetical protein HWB00_gp027 [Cronobacter phage vB_CsaM_leB]AOG16153.1 hypothetical protein B_027 [Cronobacter phage vB_CsaM_leB]
MELAALHAVFALSYIVCAVITYLFGWCVFHVNGVDRKAALIVLSLLWVIGFFYVIYEGRK